MKRHVLLAAAVSSLLLATPALAQSDTTQSTANSQAAIQQASQVTKAADFVSMAAM